MKPVNQTLTMLGQGNCMSACLASLLEMSIDDVPNFRRDFPQQDFNDAINSWLRRFNLMMLRVRLRDEDGNSGDAFYKIHPLPEGTICIGSGPSPRHENTGHSVVGEIENGFYFRLLHDPHPQGEGLKEFWTYDFLVPLDPAKMIFKRKVTE